MEEAFRAIPGVVDAAVGYAGGRTSNPDYGAVCSGTTGHAEITEVEFDPAICSVEQLLDAFWKMHDPTMDARHYRGGQYRSAIYFTTAQQEEVIRKSVAKEQAQAARPVATEIIEAPTFWRAEEYHQQYYKKNRTGAFCR